MRTTCWYSRQAAFMLELSYLAYLAGDREKGPGYHARAEGYHESVLYWRGRDAREYADGSTLDGRL